MVLVSAFVVYFLTLCPTVWVGDSGELIAAAWTQGIPHPTGYPLWLLLVKAFATLVPIGSVSWRMNLFSALCAAVAAELLARALRRLGASRIAAFGGGMTLALLGPIWGEATIARTYPLAALVSAALLDLLARWIERPRDRTLVLHQLVLGVGLANHPMVVAHLPALFAVMLGRPSSARAPELPPARRTPRFRAAFLQAGRIAVLLLALLPGLSIYLCLPRRAAADPPIEYHPVAEVDGHREFLELDSWVAFEKYFTRDFHESRKWARSPGDHLVVLGHHLRELAVELTPLGAGLLVVGGVALWRTKRRSLVVAIALLWLGNLVPLSLHGAWWDLFLYPRYLTTGFVGAALLAGVGLDAALRFVAARSPCLARAPAQAALAGVLPVTLGLANFAACDRRDGWLAADYARAICAELPDRAQYLSGDDASLYPLFALHYTEALRPDLSLVNRFYREEDCDLRERRRTGAAASDAGARPAFSADFTRDFEGLKRSRQGLVYQLRLPDEPPPPRRPFEPPPIRGLERDDEHDPFARSVIAKIEADLADAAEVRGDFPQMRRRLERVARLDPPRPWANVVAVYTLCNAADARARKDGEPLDTARDLDLAEDLATKAQGRGDKDEAFVALEKTIGSARLRQAMQLQDSDRLLAFEHLRRAAELLREPRLALGALWKKLSAIEPAQRPH
jgi:hypothetical protein